MLQIRLSIPEFSSGIHFTDPVIMEHADPISLAKTVNSRQESISFDIPVNDPKVEFVNYLRWWECWDTETNERLNFGPIESISSDSGSTRKVTGPGRSALLRDYSKSVQTFYYPIDQFLDDLRFENLSAEPRTSTIINKNTNSDYYGLSLRTKDRAIDEQTGFIAIGRDTPIKGTIKTDSYWSGIDRADHLTVDLGDKYIISKARVLLPWWGGETRNNNRVYDWSFQQSNDNSTFTTVYQTPVPNHRGTAPPNGITLYFGEDGFEADQQTPLATPIDAEYWKLNITNTHAWYGSIFDGTSSDEWQWECGESNVLLGETHPSPTISGGIINKNELTPSNDCHASAVELAFFRKIVGRDTITNLSYLQIQNDNRQITYYHVPQASEMLSAGGAVKFEPGGFFRKFDFTTGGSTTIKDEFNTTLYSGGGGHLDSPAYTRLVRFSNGSAQIVEVDTWITEVDAFSYGRSYQYTTVPNDTAVLHFRGVSVKWYATIPEDVTPGQVSIQLRSKDDMGVWSSWTTLDTLTLPVGVSAHKVWEITPESHILESEVTYELKITNLNGGFVSIDAFAGFWSASSEDLNEDEARFHLSLPTEVLQQFSGKFTGGSIYKYLGGNLTKQSITFKGDRVIFYSRKGPKYGTIKLALYQAIPPAGSSIVRIPGGAADGSLVVDLNSPYEIPQAVIFDSNDYFKDPENGLPWGVYAFGIYSPQDEFPIWVDGITMHSATGLSVKFLDTNYLDILENTSEAIQMEWDVTEKGIKVVPRLGDDTDEIYAEGRGTTIKIGGVEDVSQVATMLVITGADIDGLPLSGMIEDKATRKIMGRTIMREYDLRNVADFFTLIGAGRTELMRRSKPQQRVSISRVGELKNTYGDSFIIKSPTVEGRFRAITITRNQSSSNGTTYELECLAWPPII